MVNATQGERNRVVVHFKDGRVLKGYTHNFTALKETLHLTSEHDKDTENIYEISTADLKAIFFVKTFEGNKDYVEKKRFDEVDNPDLRGMKVKAEFSDGEIIRGTSLGYSRERKGFFLVPVDPQCNNERIYVLADALEDLKLGSDAEK
jgi:hypothetical protein